MQQDASSRMKIYDFLFPYHLFKEGESIVLYGAGNVGRKFYQQAQDDDYVRIVAIVDKNAKKLHAPGMPIASVASLQEMQFDAVLISIVNAETALEARAELMRMGIAKESIKWDGQAYRRDKFYRNIYFPYLQFMHKLWTEKGASHSNESSRWLSALRPRPWHHASHFLHAILPPASEMDSGNKIYIDVSEISSRDIGTGIQRVVNNIYVQMWRERPQEVVPIRCVGDCVMTSRRYGCSKQGMPYDHQEHLISFSPSDRLLMMDIMWSFFLDMKQMLCRAKKNGCSTYIMVHDLIPIHYPEFMHHTAGFAKWIDFVFLQCDHIICVSKTVADDVIDYYRERRLERSFPLKISWLHLGADLPKHHGTVREKIISFAQSAKFFLMVGSVNIRKNHITVLNAFVNLCHEPMPKDIRLLILGREGAKIEELKQKLAQLKNAVRRRILWIKDASDAEIQWAYQNAEALIIASKAEGFGLPIAEAANFGLPIICSDLPVFREIAGEHATYFSPERPDLLQGILSTWFQNKAHADPKQIQLHSWGECAHEILDIMEGRKKPYRVLP